MKSPQRADHPTLVAEHANRETGPSETFRPSSARDRTACRPGHPRCMARRTLGSAAHPSWRQKDRRDAGLDCSFCLAGRPWGRSDADSEHGGPRNPDFPGGGNTRTARADSTIEGPPAEECSRLSRFCQMNTLPCPKTGDLSTRNRRTRTAFVDLPLHVFVG